jgi:hypothetical protein
MNPVDISRDEVENLVASVIAETLWPSTGLGLSHQRHN